MKIPITRNAELRLFGWIAGMFGPLCWIEVGHDAIVARMGPGCRVEIPRSIVRSARRRGWHWWYGYGGRIYGRKAVGFVGTRRDVVELELSQPVTAVVLFRKTCTRFAVSVDDPDALVAALGS